MPLPSSPFPAIAPRGGMRRFVKLVVVLAVLIGADLWLLFQFAKAAGTVLAELNALFLAMLAALGRGSMAAGVLVLTWLLVEDLRDTLRSEGSSVKHNFYTR